MPSPIPRSSSLPDFSIRKPSVPSNSSTSSSKSSAHRSRKPVVLPKPLRSSKSCDLTEESLSEHNRRQAAEGKKNTQPSPYYKGLLDSQRYINRMRGAGLSPGRESHASRDSNSSSFSTILFKIQDWGSSCFTGRGRKNAAANDAATPLAQPPPPPPVLPSPPCVAESGNSVSSVLSEIPDSLVLKEFERRNEVRLMEQKPLRERVWTAPGKGSSSVQQTQKQFTVEKFGWAKKYRPKFLKDFICNRDKVEVLQDLVGRITTP